MRMQHRKGTNGPITALGIGIEATIPAVRQQEVTPGGSKDPSPRYMTRIEDLCLDAVPFAKDRLRRLSPGSIRELDRVVGTVDLSRVVGTMHSNYANRSWGDLKPVPGSLAGNIITDAAVAFQPLERATANVQALELNPDYYLSTDVKEHWSFYRIDDDYYIAEGNNRSVVGRYFLFANNLPPFVHGVTITEATFLELSVVRLGRRMWRRLAAKLARLLGAAS